MATQHAGRHECLNDRVLAKIRALTLDVVGPLTTVMEQAEADTLTTEGAVAAARMATRFTGNTSVRISHEEGGSHFLPYRRGHQLSC